MASFTLTSGKTKKLISHLLAQGVSFSVNALSKKKFCLSVSDELSIKVDIFLQSERKIEVFT